MKTISAAPAPRSALPSSAICIRMQNSAPSRAPTSKPPTFPRCIRIYPASAPRGTFANRRQVQSCHPERSSSDLDCYALHGSSASRHLRQLGDGVHVARRAMFCRGNLQLRVAHAIRIVPVDFAHAQPKLFAGLVGHCLQRIRAGLGIQKIRHGAIPRHLRKWIVRQHRRHLRRRAHHHADRLAGVGRQRRFQCRFHLRFGFRGLKDHIAAGDIGAHGTKSRRFAHRLQFRHRQLARAADIHRAQQSRCMRSFSAHWAALFHVRTTCSSPI